MSDGRLVFLEITSWAFSLGGEHFTGRIVGYRDGKYSDFDAVQVQHKLTAKEAKALNKKDGARGFSLHKPGHESDRFETPDQLRRSAIAIYKREFPHAKALMEGRGAVANAQRCIDGPQDFMEAVNLIVEQQKACGGYERNPRKMDALLRKFDALTKAL